MACEDRSEQHITQALDYLVIDTLHDIVPPLEVTGALTTSLIATAGDSWVALESPFIVEISLLDPRIFYVSDLQNTDQFAEMSYGVLGQDHGDGMTSCGTPSDFDYDLAFHLPPSQHPNDPDL